MVIHKLYLRCPYCGDSQKHEEKGHLVVYTDHGNYMCHRCGAQGYYSLSDLLVLASSNMMTDRKTHDNAARGLSLPHEAKEVLGIGPCGRYSGVSKRFVIPHELGELEVFESKDRTGKVTGYQLRSSWEKIVRAVGDIHLGYHGDHLTSGSWRRVVEGPFDVVDVSHDICVFGVPTLEKVRQLRFIPLLLCPDGDVFQDRELLKAWFKPFLKDALVQAVEILPPGKDPDEVSPGKRYRMGWRSFVEEYQLRWQPKLR